MAAAIENHTDSELRNVIRFLCGKYMKAAEIHRELCFVYGEYDAVYFENDELMSMMKNGVEDQLL